MDSLKRIFKGTFKVHRTRCNQGGTYRKPLLNWCLSLVMCVLYTFFRILKIFHNGKIFKDVQEFSWGSPSEATITIFHCTFSAYIKKTFFPQREALRKNSLFSLGRLHFTRIFLNRCASLEINPSCLLWREVFL